MAQFDRSSASLIFLPCDDTDLDSVHEHYDSRKVHSVSCSVLGRPLGIVSHGQEEVTILNPPHINNDYFAA
jgi:hypothetical protein